MRPTLLLVSLLIACTPEPRFPGNEVMGTFAFNATRVEGGEGDCTFSEIQDAFAFQGTFSRELDGGPAWFTIKDVSRDAGFDGQIVEATLSAPRQFQDCACTTTQLQETITVALISQSQDELLGGRCPESPLDGGVPPPEGEDGGVRGPGSTPSGFDALRACGQLVSIVIPGEDCACAGCTMTYRLEGVRR